MSSNIVRSFAAVFGSKFLSRILMILFIPFLVRILGPESYGDYAYLLSILSIIFVITRDGVTTGLRRFIPTTDSPKEQSQVVISLLWIGISITTIICSVYILVGHLPITKKYVNSIAFSYTTLVILYIYLELFSAVLRYTLMSNQLERISEGIEIIKTVIFIITSFLLLLAGMGIRGVLFGWVGSTLIGFGLSLVYSKKYLDISFFQFPTLSEKLRQNFLNYVTETVVFSLLLMSLYEIDILLLNTMIGSEITGIYKSALVVTSFLWFVPQTIQTIFIHSTSELWEREEIEKITNITSKTTRYNLLIMILLLIGLVVLAEEFISIYFGQEYSRAVVPLLLLLPGTLGFALARPIYATIQGHGKIRLLIGMTLFPAILNVILNVLLIPRFGMSGAAIATSIGYSLMFVVHSLSAKICGFSPLTDLNIIPVIVTSTLTIIPIYIFNSLIKSDIVSLLLIPPVGLLLFVYFSLKTGAVSHSEFKTLTNKISLPN